MTLDKFQHDIKRPIIFTDLETTGFKPGYHEIIEIGAVLTTPDLEFIDAINLKVKPVRIETASAGALAVNGYNAADWEDAMSLEDALEEYNNYAADATFVAHNASFDWRFIQHAYAETGIESQLSGQVICNLEFARYALRGSGVKGHSQAVISEFLGLVPEPTIHRAVNGARLAHQVYEKLHEIQ